LQFARSLALCVLLASVSPALAQEKLNQNTVMVLAGENRWLPQTSQITYALAHENGLKLLAVQGSGCVESAADLMQLSTIDAAVLTADCVRYAQAQGLLPAFGKDLAYVARLAELPIYIVTKSENKTLTSLAGQRIATGPAHSAIFATGELLLGGMGLPFSRIPKSDDEALSLLAEGHADAVLMLGSFAANTELDPARFHVIGLTAPLEIVNDYAPVVLQGTAFQGLAAADIETITTPLLLMTRQTTAPANKMKAFVSAFVDLQSQATDAPAPLKPVSGWRRDLTATQILKQRKLEPEKTKQQGEGS
jgi:TRAP-type uncharacterized transport system substrate-binding protein